MTKVSPHRPSQVTTAIVSASLSMLLVASLLAAEQPAQAQTYTVLHNLQGQPDAAIPSGYRLIQDEAGNFYGTTKFGGLFSAGALFKLDTTGRETVLYSFTGAADGAYPQSDLLRDPEGNLYGTTSSAGNLSACPTATPGCGTVFRLNARNVLTVLHTFEGGDGAVPAGDMVSVNGEIYGTTQRGGTGCVGGCGVIFKVTKMGRYTVLYRFAGAADGEIPEGLVRDTVGNLYGNALYGGTSGWGTVYKLDSAGHFSVLYTFGGGTDGRTPFGRLIRDVKGVIHGTTYAGGDPECNCGIVFRLDTTGKQTVLHTFRSWPSGSAPFFSLLDVNGALYGTTRGGGDSSCSPAIHGCGVLFQIGNAGHYTVLHRFIGGSDGGLLPSELTLGKDGNIYGTTATGGTGTGGGTCAMGCGVIFRYIP
jgi:uncharacterized repeat protein (TIGR03803 family)